VPSTPSRRESFDRKSQDTRHRSALARVRRARRAFESHPRIRRFLHYHLLASGRIDAVVESDVNILDVGACAVIVEAAGGALPTSKAPLSPDSGSVLATNGCLHAAVFDAIHACG
jgi:histidinol-phosphatase